LFVNAAQGSNSIIHIHKVVNSFSMIQRLFPLHRDLHLLLRSLLE
jgi:hypothetical protein